jgi:hypothetical protein
LRHQRNAASVLPLPVGARISVDSPRAIAGHPSCCGLVGSGNAALNHSRTAGWKISSADLERRDGVPVDDKERRGGVPVDDKERRGGVPVDGGRGTDRF